MEKELLQKIDNLENTIAEQGGKITTLENKVVGLQFDIQTLSSEISYLNQKATSDN